MKDDGGFTTCQLRAAGESDRSDKTLWERTTQRKKSDAPGTPGVGSSRAVPVVAYAACACLTMALTVLIVEMIVLLGVAAGPMLSLTDEMTTAVRSMNRGTSDIDFNFGMTINQAPPAPVAPGLQPLGESQGTGDGGNATASAEAGSAWFAWCEAAPCMESHNCTDLVMGLAEGVDPATNAPIVPLSASFCEAVDTLNANLCLCDASLEAASAGGAPFPEEGQSLVDNLGFVAMMCPDFDAEASAKDKGLCGGG